MKLGLGLDVRKASAPAFKGLLDKFTGAVAAYSTRKLKASQPNILPADYGDGAAAAYSLRKVKASYSGNCIDVRRSSDNEIASIGFSGNELDTTALEAFVNEEVEKIVNGDFATDSDWIKGTGWTISGGTANCDGTQTGTSEFKTAVGIAIQGVEVTFSFEVKNYSAGTLNATIEGTGALEFSGINANGVYSTTATSSDGLPRVTFTASSDFVGSIDDVSVIQNTVDGFVTKWYDQSGNENDAVDATQATDNDQPQIVDAGSTILENGKPAILFDGVDDWMDTGITSSQFSQVFVVKNTTGTGTAISYSGAVELESLRYNTSDDDITFSSDSGLYTIDNLNVKGYLNGVDETGAATTFTQTFNRLYFGSINGAGSFVDGKIQEYIHFPYASDQSANRQDIEWNINNHYNIYTDSWDKQSAMEVRRAIDNETTNIGFVGKDLDTTALETFATESSPVLDDYTGAAAAYSLRKVRSAYTGSAVRVRKQVSSVSSDTDIGFDANGNLDTATLLSFASDADNGDVFVSIWYDQTQNDPSQQNNATQTTANNQPLIVSGGTLVEENSKAAVDFDGVDDYFTLNAPITVPQSDFFITDVVSNVSTGFTAPYGNNSSDNGLAYPRTRTRLEGRRLTANTSVTDWCGAQGIYTIEGISNSYTPYENGTARGTALSVTGAYTIKTMMVRRASDFLGITAGKLQERIIFLSDQSANRTGIEGNIGRYYNIDGFRDVFVSKWFDQSGNFNHAENSTDTQQPQIVDGGSVITEGTTPKAALDFDGVDDHFDMSNFTSVPTISQFNVLKPSATNVDETFTSIQNATTTDGIFLGQGNIGTEAKFGLRNYQGADIADSGIAMTLQQYLLAGITTSTTAQIYANGVAGAISAKARGSVSGDSQIGANGDGGQSFSGKFQELIIFDSDQSAKRTDIESNINKHFKIYE